MCALAVLYVGVVEGSVFWDHLCRQLHQCPAPSVLVSVCGFDIHAKTHYWLKLQRGKQLPRLSVWDGETSRCPGTQGWSPGAGQEESPGPGVHGRQWPYTSLNCIKFIIGNNLSMVLNN